MPGPASILGVEARPRTRGPAHLDRAAYNQQLDAPKFAPQELYALLDPDPAKGAGNSYDVHEVIARLVDRSQFDEYKPDYGKTVVCGYARIGGFAVGIVANQKTHQTHTSQNGEKRVEFGGVIYAESAQKAARFIMDCNQNLIPLIFLHDVNGLMVGKDAEGRGIIRAGAQDGFGRGQHYRAQDNCDCWRLVRRRPLRHVRQGLRSAIPLCLAHSAVRGDERRVRGKHAGGDKIRQWNVAVSS